MPELYNSIIAAGAALLGVAISQAFSMLQRSSDRKYELLKLHRQKFEETALCISDSIQWLARVHNAMSVTELQSNSQCIEARKALTLCQLYFPELVEPVNQYILAQVSYYQHAITAYIKAGKVGNAGAHAFMAEGSEGLIDTLFTRKNELETRLTFIAEVYR